MKQLRAGTNGWMCMAVPEAMCADQGMAGLPRRVDGQEGSAVEGVGISYMLRGDQGPAIPTRTRPEPTPDNQWVVSAPHIMVLSPDPSLLDTLPTDPTPAARG